MADFGQLAIRLTQESCVRGVGQVRAKCQNCRWWQRIDLKKDEVCTNEESEQRFDETHKDYCCFLWEQKLEQDGDATWYME